MGMYGWMTERKDWVRICIQHCRKSACYRCRQKKFKGSASAVQQRGNSQTCFLSTVVGSTNIPRRNLQSMAGPYRIPTLLKLCGFFVSRLAIREPIWVCCDWCKWLPLTQNLHQSHFLINRAQDLVSWALGKRYAEDTIHAISQTSLSFVRMKTSISNDRCRCACVLFLRSGSTQVLPTLRLQ